MLVKMSKQYVIAKNKKEALKFFKKSLPKGQYIKLLKYKIVKIIKVKKPSINSQLKNRVGSRENLFRITYNISWR